MREAIGATGNMSAFELYSKKTPGVAVLDGSVLRDPRSLGEAAHAYTVTHIHTRDTDPASDAFPSTDSAHELLESAELLPCILQYLPRRDLGRVASVSRAYSRACVCESVWTHSWPWASERRARRPPEALASWRSAHMYQAVYMQPVLRRLQNVPDANLEDVTCAHTHTHTHTHAHTRKRSQTHVRVYGYSDGRVLIWLQSEPTSSSSPPVSLLREFALPSGSIRHVQVTTAASSGQQFGENGDASVLSGEEDGGEFATGGGAASAMSSMLVWVGTWRGCVHVIDPLRNTSREVVSGLPGPVYALRLAHMCPVARARAFPQLLESSSPATASVDTHTHTLLPEIRPESPSADASSAVAHHLLFTGCSDGIVRVFDSATGSVLVALQGHAGAITDMCFITHEAFPVVEGGSDDHPANAAVVACTAPSEPERDRAAPVLVAPYSSSDDAVYMRVSVAGSPPERFPPRRPADPDACSVDSAGVSTLTHTAAEHSVVPSLPAALGDRSVSGRAPHTVSKEARDLTVSSRRAHSAASSTSIRFLISTSYDGTVRVWDLSTATCVALLRGHKGPVWTVTARGETIVTGGADGTLRVWRIRETAACAASALLDWECVRTLTPFTAVSHKQIWCLQVVGEVVFAGTSDGYVHCWHILTGAHLWVAAARERREGVRRLHVQRDWLYAVTEHGRITVFHMTRDVVSVPLEEDVVDAWHSSAASSRLASPV